MFLSQRLGRGAGAGCHLFSAGQQKGAPNAASCTRAAQHVGGQLPGRFKAFLSSACPAADALISLRCTSSALPTTVACVHMLHLPCPFFSPLFFKPTTKTRSLFSKQWIESVKAHFLQGNTSAITNSSSWKPPCLSFSVQKGLHKSAALHLGCLSLLHSVNL